MKTLNFFKLLAIITVIASSFFIVSCGESTGKNIVETRRTDTVFISNPPVTTPKPNPKPVSEPISTVDKDILEASDAQPPKSCINKIPKDIFSGTLKNQLEKMHGSIIVIKSLRWNGAYIDANHTGAARVTEVANSKLFNAKWAKLKMHYISENIICLESIRYPDHYLDYGNDNVLRFTKSNEVPKNLDWARFSVYGTNLSNVGIRSERWTDRWLDAHPTGNLYGAKHDPNTRPTEKWGQFEFMNPGTITSEYVPIFTKYNPNEDYTIKLTWEITSGTDFSKLDETINQVEITTEMQKNFGTPISSSGSVKVGAKYSNTWRTASTEFKKESTTMTVPIEIPPKSTFVIYQLHGTYGNNNGNEVIVKYEKYIDCLERDL
ncbi:MAG: hypothetical protein P1U56_25100 [Saprospiraceae bacterium]|nr:hypothetical protein [Saprospiraceae bacterium]